MNRYFMTLGMAVASASLMSGQTAASEHPGPLSDGSVLLHTGWRIHPAGTQISVDTFPMSAVTTPDKKFLLVLNGGRNPPSISVIDLAANKETSRSPVPDGWLGLTITKAGDKVYVGGGSRAVIYEFSLAAGVLKPARMFPVVADKDRTPADFVGDVKLSPDGRLLYAANLYRDSIVVINPQSGLVISRFKTGRRPYRILFHPSGKSVFVSSWADGAIGQYDPDKGTRLANVRVAPHVTDMLWRDGEVEDQPEIKARLFVSASNTNSVYVLGASETGDLSRLETINLALSSRQPLGTTPEGLGLTADGTKLLVACADLNATAVVDITGAHSQPLGFVPAGAYPTAAFGLPDGRLGVLNGNSGTVQLLALPEDSALSDMSREVATNSLFVDAKLDDPGTPSGNPLRSNGPVKHVLYILQDQALPGTDKLAQEFAYLDNFYLNSKSRPEALNWATAALALDYTARLSPNSDAQRRNRSDYEGEDPAATPPAGYLWTNANQAGITLHSYGLFVQNLKAPEADGTQLADVHDPVLAQATDGNFRGPDPAYADSERAKEFISELNDFAKSGNMPQLILMRLNGDPSGGAVAIASAISKTRFWNDTAIFLVSTASDEKGHAGAALISPWTKRHSVDSTMYNETSVLRSIEILLGLHPMTTYDAGARPLFRTFSDTAVPTPYTLP
jgi:YVTN family beta-propeller protein